MRIAILGVDGSGKSSTIKIFDFLEYKSVYMGYNSAIRKYSFLPFLESIISKSGLALFIYRVINDQFLIKKSINNVKVVYDRYPYDLLLYGNSQFFYRLKKYVINKYIYRPDLIFFLHGDPLSIHQRKNELSEAQISTMQKKYKNILEDLNLNYIQIDTVDKTLKEVNDFVMEKLKCE